ncbi:MAG: cytochrome b-c1 complex subunit 8 [Monoraphidium minutum]|nr:MAG: cytochrome b-c1 complex subunit 8 [Monoraphidium minutum]
MAPRLPVPLREIVYTLSPYQQQVMLQGIEKLPGKAMKFVKRNWAGYTIMTSFLMLPIWYGDWYKEQEKMEHRY